MKTFRRCQEPKKAADGILLGKLYPLLIKLFRVIKFSTVYLLIISFGRGMAEAQRVRAAADQPDGMTGWGRDGLSYANASLAHELDSLILAQLQKGISVFGTQLAKQPWLKKLQLERYPENSRELLKVVKDSHLGAYHKREQVLAFLESMRNGLYPSYISIKSLKALIKCMHLFAENLEWRRRTENIPEQHKKAWAIGITDYARHVADRCLKVASSKLPIKCQRAVDALIKMGHTLRDKDSEKVKYSVDFFLELNKLVVAGFLKDPEAQIIRMELGFHDIDLYLGDKHSNPARSIKDIADMAGTREKLIVAGLGPEITELIEKWFNFEFGQFVEHFIQSIREEASTEKDARELIEYLRVNNLEQFEDFALFNLYTIGHSSNFENLSKLTSFELAELAATGDPFYPSQNCFYHKNVDGEVYYKAFGDKPKNVDMVVSTYRICLQAIENVNLVYIEKAYENFISIAKDDPRANLLIAEVLSLRLEHRSLDFIDMEELRREINIIICLLGGKDRVPDNILERVDSLLVNFHPSPTRSPKLPNPMAVFEGEKDGIFSWWIIAASVSFLASLFWVLLFGMKKSTTSSELTDHLSSTRDATNSRSSDAVKERKGRGSITTKTTEKFSSTGLMQIRKEGLLEKIEKCLANIKILRDFVDSLPQSSTDSIKELDEIDRDMLEAQAKLESFYTMPQPDERAIEKTLQSLEYALSKLEIIKDKLVLSSNIQISRKKKQRQQIQQEEERKKLQSKSEIIGRRDEFLGKYEELSMLMHRLTRECGVVSKAFFRVAEQPLTPAANFEVERLLRYSTESLKDCEPLLGEISLPHALLKFNSDSHLDQHKHYNFVLILDSLYGELTELEEQLRHVQTAIKRCGKFLTGRTERKKPPAIIPKEEGAGHAPAAVATTSSSFSSSLAAVLPHEKDVGVAPQQAAEQLGHYLAMIKPLAIDISMLAERAKHPLDIHIPIQTVIIIYNQALIFCLIRFFRSCTSILAELADKHNVFMDGKIVRLLFLIGNFFVHAVYKIFKTQELNTFLLDFCNRVFKLQGLPEEINPFFKNIAKTIGETGLYREVNLRFAVWNVSLNFEHTSHISTLMVLLDNLIFIIETRQQVPPPDWSCAVNGAVFQIGEFYQMLSHYLSFTRCYPEPYYSSGIQLILSIDARTERFLRYCKQIRDCAAHPSIVPEAATPISTEIMSLIDVNLPNMLSDAKHIAEYLKAALSPYPPVLPISGSCFFPSAGEQAPKSEILDLHFALFA